MEIGNYKMHRTEEGDDGEKEDAQGEEQEEVKAKTNASLIYPDLI